MKVLISLLIAAVLLGGCHDQDKAYDHYRTEPATATPDTHTEPGSTVLQ
jgi:PBP1b-binding outer membrane lipoprotein LpoB